MQFSKLKNLTIPEGVVNGIKVNGEVRWNRINFRYVSLGDSIAAGHAIRNDERLGIPRCWEWQYGTEGIESTELISGCYTDLIRQYLHGVYGEAHISAKSFARSSERVADLISKLRVNEYDNPVANAVRQADLVTLCIGANDVLIPALTEFDDYVIDGRQALANIGSTVQGKIDNLASTSSTSYTALFNELKEINPNAKYVFTTVYNPYKYLWLEEGVNGFFKPVLDVIPEMDILWGAIDVDEAIKDFFLTSSYVQTLFDRANAIAAWTEIYVSKLNEALIGRINAYNNPNFVVADTKKLFESIPDRPITADKHYNDLVNVEYTRGYDTAKMDWGKLWPGSDAITFWKNLINKYIGDLDMGGLISELVDLTIEKVIKPDIDPHPKTYGHYALYRSFADAIGWESLYHYTATYNANGGSGAMAVQNIVGVNSNVYAIINPNKFTPATGYYFTGWQANGANISTAKDANGNVLYYYMSITANTTITAQWSNMYTVRYRQTKDSSWHSSIVDEAQDYYALYLGQSNIDSNKAEAKLGSDPSAVKTCSLPYGTKIKVYVGTRLGAGSPRSTIWDWINKNGQAVGDSYEAYYTFTLTRDTDIIFGWHAWLVNLQQVSFWNCDIKTLEI